MKSFRRLRPIFLLFNHHRFLTFTVLFILIQLAIFHKEIIYTIYISVVDLDEFKSSITFWSTDFHISPIRDLKALLSPMGVKFFDKSLSFSCSMTGTCFSPLRVLTRENAWTLSEDLKRKFFEFYRDQIEIKLVDAFVCFHPAAMCELYMPFNRSLIIIASTRYELARFQADQWNQWNENLKLISQNPKNIIAANNLYDAEYIRYFTGIKVTVLPSFCHYTDVQYNPSREQFLLSPIHATNFETIFLENLRKISSKFSSRSPNIVPLRKLYKRYKYSDLTAHRAIIHIPYQVSIMSLFEQYRMNIPIVCPSLDLLVRWHFQHMVVLERTWDMTFYGIRPNRSHIDGILPNVPDPNNEHDRDAIRYWLKFADFYQWPHVVYFHSIEDLLLKLVSTNFTQVSENMKVYNRKVQTQLNREWTEILRRIQFHSSKFR